MTRGARNIHFAVFANDLIIHVSLITRLPLTRTMPMIYALSFRNGKNPTQSTRTYVQKFNVGHKLRAEAAHFGCGQTGPIWSGLFMLLVMMWLVGLWFVQIQKGAVGWAEPLLRCEIKFPLPRRKRILWRFHRTASCWARRLSRTRRGSWPRRTFASFPCLKFIVYSDHYYYIRSDDDKVNEVPLSGGGCEDVWRSLIGFTCAWRQILGETRIWIFQLF